MNNQNLRRIFFALWPDDETRENISKAFDLSGFKHEVGRDMGAHNLHLTLHFLGDVSLEKFNCVQGIAQKIEFQAFDMQLSQFGFFQKSKIFYMGMPRFPDELLRLQAGFGEALKASKYQPEERVFTPHVTLKRKINRFDINEIKMQTVNWHVNQFAFVESLPCEAGVVYKPIKFFDSVCKN